MTKLPSDIAFTPAVKAVQTAKGSRAAYQRMERGRGWQTQVTPDLADILQSEIERLEREIDRLKARLGDAA